MLKHSTIDEVGTQLTYSIAFASHVSSSSCLINHTRVSRICGFYDQWHEIGVSNLRARKVKCNFYAQANNYTILGSHACVNLICIQNVGAEKRSIYVEGSPVKARHDVVSIDLERFVIIDPRSPQNRLVVVEWTPRSIESVL